MRFQVGHTIFTVNGKSTPSCSLTLETTKTATMCNAGICLFIYISTVAVIPPGNPAVPRRSQAAGRVVSGKSHHLLHEMTPPRPDAARDSPWQYIYISPTAPRLTSTSALFKFQILQWIDWSICPHVASKGDILKHFRRCSRA